MVKRGRGRPPTKSKAVSPTGPQVFLTREQLAERWHCKPATITRNYAKLGIKKIVLNGRWLASLTQVEELEKKIIGKVA
jgi:hypothetical protein